MLLHYVYIWLITIQLMKGGRAFACHVAALERQVRMYVLIDPPRASEMKPQVACLTLDPACDFRYVCELSFGGGVLHAAEYAFPLCLYCSILLPQERGYERLLFLSAFACFLGKCCCSSGSRSLSLSRFLARPCLDWGYFQFLVCRNNCFLAFLCLFVIKLVQVLSFLVFVHSVPILRRDCVLYIAGMQYVGAASNQYTV